MKIVFASDSFKGTLSSRQIAGLLEKAAQDAFLDCDTVGVTVADGGEGTIDAVTEACGGTREHVTVRDPLGNPTSTYYGRLDGDTAIIEMALASGLTLIPEEKRDPLATSSYGTGELVRHALEAGLSNIIIAIGGSATNDGGMGFAKALGIRFLDADGNDLDGCGSELEKICRIDMSGLIPEAGKATLTCMCDVTNPLCGKNGATYTYGRQKGADDETLERLEAGMKNYRDVIRREFGIDPDEIQGAGAAGGLGTALKVFLNAGMQSGIKTVLDRIGFESIICDADLIITGEGRLDAQSMNGKVVFGVGEAAKKYGIPVIALCGCTGRGYEEIYEHGISRVITTAGAGMEPAEAMEHAEELYMKAAAKMFFEIKEQYRRS